MNSNASSPVSLSLPACAIIAWAVIGFSVVFAAEGPDPIFVKPAPVTMAELSRATANVAAVEVSDYAPGRYSGLLAPSPPHADLNARKAVVILWKDHAHRFVFSHEASYCPLLELPSGVAMCNQFFEGNLGDAELFNNMGRKEKNSFVDIVESGPERVWVRWNYFAVNMNDDSQPRLRGTEDYFAYPNGLVLRRMTYESLMPQSNLGYSQQPVELFGVVPVGKLIQDVFPWDEQAKGSHTHAVLDIYSEARYDVFWGEDGAVRRRGDDAHLAAIARSPGRALVLPFRERLLFAVLGDASGFPAEKSVLIDHCTPGAAGGAHWGAGRWDHWPIGWLNSQTSDWKPSSPNPYSFGSIGQFFVPEGRRYRSFVPDMTQFSSDMELNRWTSDRVFYVLLGTADDSDAIRRIGRNWLDKGTDCAQPQSIAELK
jgi:hypothetical protein